MSADIIGSKYAIKSKHLWHSSQVYCLAFDRSGRFIFTGGDDGVVKVYSTKSDRLVHCLSDGSEADFAEEVEFVCQSIDFDDSQYINLESKTETFAIQDIAVNYENTLIAAAKYTGCINVWNLKTFKLITRLDEQIFPIRTVRFSPFAYEDDKKYLISVSTDGFIYFYAYDVNTLEFTPNSVHRKTKYDNERAVNICCDFSTGGLLLGVVHTFGIPMEVSRPKSKKIPSNKKTIQSAIRIINISDDSIKEEWKYTQHKTHAECEYSFAFSHNTFRFASGCDKDSNVFVWSFDKGNKKWDSIIIDINAKDNKKILRGKSKKSLDSSVFVDEFTFSCDDKYLIMILSDNSMKVWNSESGELVAHFKDKHTDKISVIECHPQCDHICLSAGYDSNIFVYDILTKDVIKHFDCSIAVNNLKGNSLLESYDNIRPLLLQCTFSPDGQTIAATDNLGNMTVFTVESTKKCSVVDQLEAELLRIHSEAESEDSSDGQALVESIPGTTSKDLELFQSVFEFELDLLRGVEKPSPAKFKSEEKMIEEKEAKVIRILSMNDKLTKPLTKTIDALPKKLIPKKKVSPKQKEVPQNKAIDTKVKSEEPSQANKAKPSIAPRSGRSTKQVLTEIMDQIFENPNSIPFQTIDHILWPTYRKEISDADLSLGSIRELMVTEKMFTFRRFNSLMNNVFENVKIFFKHKEDEIYEMAITLEKYYCKKMVEQFGDSFREPEVIVSDSEDSDDNKPKVSKVKPKSTPKTVTNKSHENDDKVSDSHISAADFTTNDVSVVITSTNSKRTTRNIQSLSKSEVKSSKSTVDVNGKDIVKSTEITKVSKDVVEESNDQELSVTPKRKSQTKPISSLPKRLKSNGKLSANEDIGVNSQPIKPRKSSQDSSNVVAIDMDALSPEVQKQAIVETPINKEIETDNTFATESDNVNSCDINVNKKKSLFCLFCDQFFGDKNEAVTHYVMHLCPLKCVNCNRLFATYDQFLRSHDCGRPKTPQYIEWSRHYSDTIVWINRFLDFQLSEDIHLFASITHSDTSCIVCQKAQQLTPDFPINRQLMQSLPIETHIEKHLKYETQYQCLICSLNKDKYFYCKTSAQADQHVLEEHKEYRCETNGALSDSLKMFFDGSIPKLDDIVFRSFNP